MGQDANKTRITTVGGNPTKYGNQSARIRRTLNNGLILTPDGSTGTAHILYDDGRLVTYDNSGDEVPVAAEYVDYWHKAFAEAQKNARSNLFQKGVHWVGDKLTQVGDRLSRFEEGGVATQQPSQDQVMKELMAIVQQAATELQSNKPGQGVQTLAQIANDPQGSQLLDALVQQVPEAGQIVEAVMKMVGAFKCGGKTKKKIKKGAKGCVPCKKLMRVGGKLVNVWSDCEGNIISKHQVGGRFIPKAEKGFTKEQLAMLNTDHNLDWALKQNASTSMKQGIQGTKYYLGDDGKTLYSTTSTQGADGNYYWDKATNLGDLSIMSDADRQKYGIVKNNKGQYTIGNTWDQGKINTTNASALTNLSGLGDAYTTTTIASGPIQYYDGTVWRNMISQKNADGTYRWVTGNEASLKDFGDDDMRTSLTVNDLIRGTITADQAKTAGINTSDFETGNGFMLKGNSLLGTTNGASDAVEKWGGMGTYRKINKWYRKDRREAIRDSWAGRKGDQPGQTFQSRRDERLGKVKEARGNYYSHLSKALHDKWANYNTGTNAWETTSTESNPQPFDMTSKSVEQTTSTVTQPQSFNITSEPVKQTKSIVEPSASSQQSVLYTPQEYMPALSVYNKQGGWLTKFN